MYRSAFFSFLSVALATAVLTTTSAQAGYVYFDNNTADGKYETAGNWFDGSGSRYIPWAGVDGIIADGLTATLSSNLLGYVPDNLYVGFVDPDYANTSGDGTLTLDNAASVLTVGVLSAGYSADSTGSTGTVNVSAGSLNTNGLSLGPNAGGNGTLSISGGTITSTNTVQVGSYGTGTLNLSAGTANFTDKVVNLGTFGTGVGYGYQTGGSVTTGYMYIGKYGGVGSYEISDGTLDVTGIVMGEGTGSNGTFTQTGGTVTVGNGAFLVGNNGTGTYSISGSSALNMSCITFIGNTATGDGTFNQSGGTVSTNYKIVVGESGTGHYNMTGGTTTCANVILAENSGSDGYFEQDGGSFTTTGKISIGSKGVGTMTLNGGSITAAGKWSTLYIGEFAGGDGTLYINETATTSPTVSVYYADSPLSQVISIGHEAGATGKVVQTGGTFFSEGWLTAVGRFGTGEYELSGGTADLHNICVGYEAGGTGTFTHTGGTIENGTGGFRVGGSGTGTYTMSDTAECNFDGIIIIAHLVGSDGTLNVNGGTLTDYGNGHDIYVGEKGVGRLNVTDGTISVRDIHVGQAAAGVGYVDQSGGSITVGKILLGYKNDGTLGNCSYDMSGGTLTCRNGGAWDGIYVGYTSADTQFNQTGGAIDADWISVGSGEGGNGTMNVSGGTMNSVNEFSIGGNATATGAVNVSGGTITLDYGTMYVGHRGIGTLNLTGGTVTSYESRIGNDAGSSGEATVSGSGSNWINTGSLHVGELGMGTLEISDHGLVTVAGTLTIDSDLDGNAFVNMSTGGMLALLGDADDSLTDFLGLIDGTDAIRYWDDSLSSWVDLTQATYGQDYTLSYLSQGDLAGYTQLTVGIAGSISGDLNGDGYVGSDDLDIVRSHWGQSVEAGLLSAGDASGDGYVGSPDLDIVRANWGQGVLPRAAAVPEPGLPVLLFIATALIFRRARRVG